MGYQSNLPNVLERMRTARDAGLIAAAEVVRTRLKNGLRGGYTSGAWVTGETVNSIKITVPHDDEGGRAIRVYSELKTALYWMVGHRNLFTRRFERVDKWTPAMMESLPEQIAAFNRTYTRFMGDGV